MANGMATEGRATGTRAVGEYGEQLACRYLRERGMVIVDRNWRCEHGEIDIVARDGDCLVVCEVKTRRGTGFGEPVDAVIPRKVARLRRLTGVWLVEHPDEASPQVRIDVIGVLCRGGQPVQLRHVEAVGS